ncbi:MAG: arginine--tRNA ligase [Aerococcus sp.]|nr:arginine--tRNA ligase [Aerococcus sp.]
MESKKLVVELLLPVVGEEFTATEISDIVEAPNKDENGDWAFPAFKLAKTWKKNPVEIAKEIAEKLPESDAFAAIKPVGPYVNFFLNRTETANTVLNEVLNAGESYGSKDLGKGRNITLDMSSPNIAKPMSMGHLRSTVIGNSLAQIVAKLGYNPVKINHLGDWGTQFGKLIVAYRKWGNPEDVRGDDAINELVKLYVKFHVEAEKDPELDDEARATFKALEDGDPEVTELWKLFRDESLKEFNSIYERLGVEFDYNTGESFYEDKMQEVIDDLKEDGLLHENEGAQIVELDDDNLPPALIQKSDGATLYITRDLATAYYRKRTFDFVQSLYVVGSEQAVHFQQLKAVLAKLGKEWQEQMHHIQFGLITVNGKKLSTRAGKIILLKDVLDEAQRLAKEQIEAKNPDLPNKEQVAQEVGVGAVIFHDLKSERLNNFDFSLEEVVRFEGETGPYVQYTNARAQSLLEKAGVDIDLNEIHHLDDDFSWRIVKLLNEYPEYVQRAFDTYEPSVIAKYTITLAQAFNKYYGNTRILDKDDQLNARLALVKATTIVLKDGLGLLGVKAPDKM